MQVFATSNNPTQCAIWLDDRRLNKMITESAQILCTILRADGITNLPFKSTHAHHPITVWASNSDEALWWLARHHLALHDEWQYRFGKTHASGMSKEHLASVRASREPKTFQNSAKNTMRELDFTWVKDVHLAYQFYLTARWLNDTIKPKWTKRSEPVWYDYPFKDHDIGMLFINRIKKMDLKLLQTLPCPRCGGTLNVKSPNEFYCTEIHGCLTWVKTKLTV